MEKDFTLYCFSVIFNFSPSGKSHRGKGLFKLFSTQNGDNLYRWVKGETNCNDKVYNINKDNIADNSKRIIKKTVINVYINVIGTTPEESKSKVDMLFELLEYAVAVPQNIQKEIYEHRYDNEIKEYIKWLTTAHTSDDENNSNIYSKSDKCEDFIKNVSIDDFFKNVNINNIDHVQMAFHTGIMWLEPNYFSNPILISLLKNGINIRVIINTIEITSNICNHLRSKESTDLYKPFEIIIKQWEKLAEKYPNLELKITNLPIFHNYVAFISNHYPSSIMRVIFYTYGNPTMSKNNCMIFKPESTYFELYKGEFNYLWEL